MMKISSYHMKTSKYLNALLTIIKHSAVIKKEKIKLHLVREKYTSRWAHLILNNYTLILLAKGENKTKCATNVNGNY
jgi:hypothetical protein